MTAATTDEGGCWRYGGDHGRRLWQRWTIETAFNGGGGGGVRWRHHCSTTFDGVGDGLRRVDERAAQGQATQKPASSQHDERTRGWCNEKTTRDDGATIFWRVETTRGGTTRRRDDERAARREATQKPAGATRGREGTVVKIGERYYPHQHREGRSDLRGGASDLRWCGGESIRHCH